MKNIFENAGERLKEENISESKERIVDFAPERQWNEQEKEAIEVVRVLKEAGFEAYFAGGAARDYLCGREPKDIDIATSGAPDDVEEIFKSNAKYKVYYKSDKAKEHGIVNIKIGEKIEFEVASFREDVYRNEEKSPEQRTSPDGNQEESQKHVKGRHADEVRTGVAAQKDAKRRDLTINGMFYDPVRKIIIDYVGGYEDLQNGIARFVDEPEVTIDQDHMRLIRFFRFKNVFDLKADEKSINGIKSWLAEEDNRKEFEEMFCLNQRIRQEFGKILASGKRVEILDDLMNYGVLELIIPQVAKMKGVRQPEEFHQEGDVWEHTKRCLKSLLADAPLELVWAVLLHDAGKSETQKTPERDGTDRIRFDGHDAKSGEIAKFVLHIEKVAKRFRKEGLNEDGERLKGLNYDEAFISSVAWLVSNHMHHMDFHQMNKTNQMRLMDHPEFENLLQVWKADIEGSMPFNDEDYQKAVGIWESYKKEKDEKAETSDLDKIEKSINSELIMEILAQNGYNMNKSGVVEKESLKLRVIVGLMRDYLTNVCVKAGRTEISENEAKEKIKELLEENNILDEAVKFTCQNPEIIRMKEKMAASNAKERKKIEKVVNNKAEEIFSSFVENKLGL